MSKVQSRPWWWAAGGAAALGGVSAVVPIGIAGWAAGLAYLAVSSALLARGLARTGATRFGPANAITATRSALVGVATALVAASFAASGSAASGPIAVALLVGVAAVALALDGVDGAVARRTGSVTELGARFDMEVDAFLILVLSVFDVRLVGWWVLAIGLMRYAFVAAAVVAPWMRRSLPPRYWRKVVAASCGIALAVVASGLLPEAAAIALAAAALLLLVESFGRDVLWLARTRPVNRTGTGSVSSAQGGPAQGGPAQGPEREQVRDVR